MATPIPKFIVKRSRIAPAGFTVVGHQEELYGAYMASFADGDVLTLVVKKESTKRLRSLRANAYYWGVVIKILSDYFGYTPEEMHNALGLKFRVSFDVIDLPTVVGTSTMNSPEFWKYVEDVRTWAATEWGVEIPDPESVEMSK